MVFCGILVELIVVLQYDSWICEDFEVVVKLIGECYGLGFGKIVVLFCVVLVGCSFILSVFDMMLVFGCEEILVWLQDQVG